MSHKYVYLFSEGNGSMKELLGGGTTLLYVSHNIDEVKRLCDHAIWIEKGVEKMQGNAKEVCEAYMEAMKK